MSTGLKAPLARGLARPAPVKKTGLAKPTTSLTKTPSATRVVPSRSTSREYIGPSRSASRGALRPSSSSNSLSGLSRSESSVSINELVPLELGTKVTTKDTNLEGTVRFYGEPQFAKGVWVGVELDTEQGKNSGEVRGVRYFECKPNHGLFCKPEKLAKIGQVQDQQIMRPMRSPSQVDISKVDYEAKFGLKIGAKCIVNDAKQGTLLFVGLTKFAQGVWAGVALDTCDGKNDGSVKGERYFTCDPGYGLFSQANKIQMVDSPVTSSSSLASFDTPRRPSKPASDGVMKPDFVNRTPVPTPGVKSSLSGMLGKSRDIESMQKNIGDLQQRLNEVKSSPARNGPSIPSTPVPKVRASSSDQYEQLKKMHEQSENERNELAEKVKAAEKEKLTYEGRLTEIAETAGSETKELNHTIDQLNKEILVINANNSSEVNKLQEEITLLENELASSLDKMTDYETASLHNDHSAELSMSRDQISELRKELQHIRSSGASDDGKISELKTQLADTLRLSEEAQQDLEGKRKSIDDLTDRLLEAQGKVVQLESQVVEGRSNLSALESRSEVASAAEKRELTRLAEEFDLAERQISELNAEKLSMRSAHETYVVSSDQKLNDIRSQLLERDRDTSGLKSELSALSTSASADKLNLEGRLEDSLNNAARLEDQTARDAARILDLESLVSSAETDGNSQLITAHKKISELEGVLKEREIASKDEMKAVHDTVTELKVQLSNDKQSSTDLLESANKKCRDLQTALDQSTMERSMEQTQTEKDIGELHMQLVNIDKLRADNSSLRSSVKSLESELSSSQSLSNELVTTVATLKSDLETNRGDHATTVEKLTNNLGALASELAAARKEKSAECEKNAGNAVQISGLFHQVQDLKEELGNTVSESEQKVSLLQKQLEEKEENSGSAISEISTLRDELGTCREQLSDSKSQLHHLTEECDRNASELEDSRVVLSEMQSNYNRITDEKVALSRDLSKVSNELGELKVRTNRQSDEEIENLHKQISNLTDENDVMKLTFSEKNAEFAELSTEVSSLREISETAFLELKKNEQQFSSSVKKLKTTEIQLDEAFSKVKDLQTKINDLEEELVRERSRANELEQALNSPPVMSFENLDNLSNISSSPPVPSNVPIRVFCDNCDVFDEHDTDQCHVGTSPEGVRHGGLKGLSGRPYCSVCEMFGHTATECEDDMTF